jgi:hypothetical protein
MATKPRQILVNLDLNGNQILNAVVQVLATAPSSPVQGQVYFDSTINSLSTYNGSAWRSLDAGVLADGSIANTALTTNPLARANHTGTQLAATISDFNTGVRLNSIDQLAIAAGAVNLNSHQINNVTDPTSSQDAATKNYVDLLSQGIKDQKIPVRVVAVANSALSGLLTIDGVTLGAGDRVLATAQTTASQNGIYIASSGAWARSTDMNTTGQVIEGTTVLTNEGTTYSGSQWRCSTTGTITIGTTSTTYVQFAAASVYSAGNGLSLVGSTFNVVPGNGILADGTSTRVDRTKVPNLYATSVGDGSSTTYTITHSLATLDVIVQLYRNSGSFEQIETDVQHATTNTITLNFNAAPSTNQFRVVCLG